VVETELAEVPGDLFLRLFGTNGPREWIGQFKFRGEMGEIEKKNPALFKLLQHCEHNHLVKLHEEQIKG